MHNKTMTTITDPHTKKVTFYLNRRDTDYAEVKWFAQNVLNLSSENAHYWNSDHRFCILTYYNGIIPYHYSWGHNFYVYFERFINGTLTDDEIHEIKSSLELKVSDECCSCFCNISLEDNLSKQISDLRNMLLNDYIDSKNDIEKVNRIDCHLNKHYYLKIGKYYFFGMTYYIDW